MLVNTTNISNHHHRLNNIIFYNFKLFNMLVRYNQSNQQQTSLSSLPSPPTSKPITSWCDGPLTHDVNGIKSKNEEEEDE